jgi:RNA polymerase sigma-70 factor, ECF subfamily
MYPRGFGAATHGARRAIRRSLLEYDRNGHNAARSAASLFALSQRKAAIRRMDDEARARGNEERLRQLLLRALAGDSAAYRAFLSDSSGHLRAFFRRRLARWPDDVEDLVQETLLAVHNQRHTYDPEQPLTAWLHAIARYKLVDLLRQRSRRERRHDPLDDESTLLAHDDSEAVAARIDVIMLLNRLPDRQRMPIVHMKLEGLSVFETARVTGMSEAAVKVAVHRGLKALAALLRMQR